jgi:hypothetical protein
MNVTTARSTAGAASALARLIVGVQAIRARPSRLFEAGVSRHWANRPPSSEVRGTWTSRIASFSGESGWCTSDGRGEDGATWRTRRNRQYPQPGHPVALAGGV